MLGETGPGRLKEHPLLGDEERTIRHEVRVYRHLDDVLRYLQEHPLEEERPD